MANLWRVWRRRLVSLPLYALLLMAVGATAPLWIPVLLLLDLATDARLPRTRAMLFFLHYLVCEALGVLGALGVWLALAGGAVGGRARFIAANAALQRWWSWLLFGGASVIFDFHIVVEGADRARAGPFLLFVRHSSTADTLLAAWVVANPNRILLRYVLKEELLWDPCLDIVGRRMPNAFLNRRHDQVADNATAVASLACGLDDKSGVLIYPEGTRFSPRKLAAAREGLRERGRTVLANIARGYRSVMPPKLAGPLSLLEEAPGTDVVFLDQQGFEGAADFREFWLGALVHKTIRVRLRRVRAMDIPPKNRDVWLFEQWLETDRFVSSGAA